MKKLVASLAISALALSHTMASAAQSTAALDRAASPVSESEGMAGGAGAGIWAVIAAVVVGIGAIVFIEEEEDDLPTSP